MATTPPTAAEADAFMSSDSINGNQPNALALFEANSYADLTGANDSVYWVVAYTDNAGAKHYEALGLFDSSVADATDVQLQQSSPPVANGGGPFYVPGQGGALVGSPEPTNHFIALPYLSWLKSQYGSVLLRGYLLPGFRVMTLNPVSSAVQDWVNDTANWPAGG